MSGRLSRIPPAPPQPQPSVTDKRREEVEQRRQAIYDQVYAAVFAGSRLRGIDVDAADYAAHQDARSAAARMKP